MDSGRVQIIPPSIDPCSPKERRAPAEVVHSILAPPGSSTERLAPRRVATARRHTGQLANRFRHSSRVISSSEEVVVQSRYARSVRTITTGQDA